MSTQLRDLVNVSPCFDVGPILFDSLDYRDHVLARETCLECPARAACRDLALADPTATGTYGGDLFRDGSVVMAIDT